MQANGKAGSRCTRTCTSTHTFSTISPQFVGSMLRESGPEFDQDTNAFQEERAGSTAARKSLPLTSCKHK